MTTLSVTLLGKQIVDDVENVARVTLVGKQIIFSTEPVDDTDTDPTPAAPGVRRTVLYLCETIGARILAYGVGITQVGDDFQGELETWDLIPSTETGSNFFRSVNVALNATGAHTIGITPIVDGKALPEQIFSGAGDGETAYEAFIGKRGARIRVRVRTISRAGPIELEMIAAVVVPVRQFP